MSNSIYTYGQVPGSGSGGTVGDTVKLGGQPIALGAGNVTAGTQRVTIATNDAAIALITTYLAQIDVLLTAVSASLTSVVASVDNLNDWDEFDRCKVNMYLNDGVIVDIGTGVVDLGTQRITIATNDQVVTCLTELASATGQANSGSTPTSPIIRVQPIDAAGNIITGNPNVTADVTELGGNAINLNAGAAGTGTQRVVLANDQYVAVSKDGNANATGNRFFTASNIDQLNGNTIDLNNGAAGAGTIRVVHANDKTVLVSKDVNANATGNRIFTASNIDQLNGTTISVNNGTMDNGTQRVCLSTDGPGVANLSTLAGAIRTDGAAAGTTLMQIGGTDGTNAQIAKMGADGAQYIEFNSARPGEDAINDWVEVAIQSHLSALVADNAAVTVDGTTEGTSDEILPSTAIGNYRGWSVWVKNTGATALNHVYVYVSRNGSDWTNVDVIKNSLELACDSLAGSNAVGLAFTCLDNPGWLYIKATATVAAGSTTAFGAVTYQM